MQDYDYDSASSCQGIYDALPNLEQFGQVKNTHGGVLLLALLRGYFSRLLNCATGIKSRKAT